MQQDNHARQAVIFGAGNIGRGFIGQLFSESGYVITFVDVDAELVNTLDEERRYRLQTVFNDEEETLDIGPVRAIHGRDVEQVAQAVAEADIGATAVGAGALKHIAPAMARGIDMRTRAAAPPLNIIICENLKHAAAHMRELLLEQLDPAARDYLKTRVGLVDTVIGRMVPIPTEEMRARDVSLIRVEPYKELPVDRGGFRGEIPEIVAMEPQDNFPLFTARKLYIHNCGHALLAYVGYLQGYEYGYEALEDERVRTVLDGGLSESVDGIAQRFGCEKQWLEEHRRDLMKRFGNRLLADTIFRLGRDPLRKLAPSDRLVGAATLVQETGSTPCYLAWGIGAAFCFDPEEDESAGELQARIERKGIEKTLESVTGLDPESTMGTRIIEAYRILHKTPTAPCPW